MNPFQRILCLALALFALSPLFAQTAESAADVQDAPETVALTAGVSLNWEDFVSTRESIRFDYSDAAIDIIAELSMSNDKKYGADIANLPGGTFLGNYFLMDEGGLRFKAQGLTLEAGRFSHKDPVGGPYSLFINSAGPAAVSAKIRYESGPFLYESVWLELNANSESVTTEWATGFPDRGASVKTYALLLADGMRLGFQDSAVYTGRSFDYEYFLSPMPQYFIQYVKGTAGRPWTTGANENNIIGLFWDWDTEAAKFSVQTLMDDFNLNFLLPDTPNNPWKAAWALDAVFKTALGEFGFHHAGATKHSFQPSIQDTNDPDLMAYGYTYYPDVIFEVDGEWATIAIQDNMIGYLHGENNIAFMLDWRPALSGLDAYAALEYVISGAKSPANPWHELYGAVDYTGTKVIADDVLEHRITLKAEAKRSFGAVDFYASVLVGYVFNELRIEAPGGVNPKPTFFLDDIFIFRPSDISRGLFSLTVGVKASLDLVGFLGLGR